MFFQDKAKHKQAKIESNRLKTRYKELESVIFSVFEEFRKDENGHFIAMQAIKK
jgi:hypothetical protein